MSRKSYFMVSGAKNNAGDHLIKHSAINMFKELRADRCLVHHDGWKRVSGEQLGQINASQAMLLVGGPAVQRKMVPNVYAFEDILDKIRVPIIMVGVGWYSPEGEWHNTYRYRLNDLSKKLLQKVNESGFLSSVRDFHTQNALMQMGYVNFIMTGCPALYRNFQSELKMDCFQKEKIKKIGISLGVGMKDSFKMYTQMQQLVLEMKDQFIGSSIAVVFHHSPSEQYFKSHGASKNLYKLYYKFSSWLTDKKIEWIDISGSADKLRAFYDSVDFHIGYRVHAHIYATSIGKPSILINEDGRGKALYKVLGGVGIDAYRKYNNYTFLKVLNKFGLRYGKFFVNENINNDIKFHINNAQNLFSRPYQEINVYKKTMTRFVEQLP